MKNEMQITNREYTKYANMNLLLYSRTSIYRRSANTIRERERERERKREPPTVEWVARYRSRRYARITRGWRTQCEIVS